MVRLVKYITIVGTALLLTACPEPMPEDDIFLRIVNNSEEDIFWMFNFEDSGEWYKIDAVTPWLEYEEYVILKGDIYVRGLNSGAIKENLKRGWIKYYLFNYDSVKTIPWKRICDERIILKEVRFDSWEDFKRCNFEIIYP